MNCPNCHSPIPEQAVLEEAGRLYAGRRKNPGRNPIPQICPRCKAPIESARALRKHKCEKPATSG